MEFDKSKVYTALNADELEPGDGLFKRGYFRKVQDNATGETHEVVK